MRFLGFGSRNLKETYRDPMYLGFLLGFPLVFMLLFGLAFGGNIPEYKIGVIDQDRSQISQAFVSEALDKAFDIKSYDDPNKALDDLKGGKIRAYIILPEGFGEKIFRTWQGQSEDISLDIRYDQSDLMVSEQILSITDSITRAFARIEVPITLNATPLNLKAKITYIDFIAPGIIVFGLLILIPTAARMMVRDKELGFLSRMLTTPTKPSEFIAGYSLCLLAIAVAQIVIFMLMGRLFGMDIVGNIGLAFVTFLLTGLCCIGIGMIIASLTKTQNQAEPLSWLISMPMATISGAWFAIEFMPTWLRSVAYAFPFAHSIDASRDILTRGTGLGAVSNDYMFLGIWTVVVFAAGIILFRRSMTS